MEFFLANAGLLETLVSVRNRTAGRRGRQNVCVWQTWRGYHLRVLSWSSLNVLCSLVFYKKINLKESQVWRKVISKQNYCHACLTRFAVFLPLPSCCVSSLFKIRRRRRQVKRRFKSEFAVFQSSSRWKFHLACFVEWTDLSWSWIPKSLIQVKKEKKISSLLVLGAWCYTRRFATTIFSATQG